MVSCRLLEISRLGQKERMDFRSLTRHWTLASCNSPDAAPCKLVNRSISTRTSAYRIVWPNIYRGLHTLFRNLDGVVRVYVNSKDTGETIACMEVNLSNTKSVYNPAVGWATAVIAGLRLVAAGLTSGLGYPNTAAHVAANTVSLFGFFQAQAIIGMTSVTMPPDVQ